MSSGRSYPVEAPIVGDAKISTTALLAALDRNGGAARTRRGRLDRQWARGHRLRPCAPSSHRSGRRRVCSTRSAPLLEPGTVVVKDSTIPAYTWGNRLLPVQRPRTSIMPNSFAIGLGVAAGARRRRRDRTDPPVVLLAGDGGFLLAATELATVAQEQLPIVVLVFADGGYGILRNIQDTQYGSEEGRIGVDLGRPDFVGLARAFGIASERVESAPALATATKKALAGPGPCLIEVDLGPIGPMAVPYTGTSSLYGKVATAPPR